MGFLDWLLGTEQEEQKIEIPEEYMKQFESSDLGQLEMMDSQLYKIAKFYPEIADNIEREIEEIRIKLQSGESGYEVTTQLRELKSKYKEWNDRASQRYFIFTVDEMTSEMMKIRKRMDVNSDSQREFLDSANQTLEEIKSKEEYILSATKRISEFKGQERNLLIASLMKAKYHITMAKIQYAYKAGTDYFDNYIKTLNGATEVEKIYWGSLLKNDLDEMISDYNRYYAQLEELKILAAEHGTDTTYIEKQQEQLSKQLDSLEVYFEKALTDDFQPTELFKNKDFLRLFTSTRIGLNVISHEIKKETDKIEIPAKKDREENEKWINMTESEVEEHLREIEGSVFDMREKYRRTMEFQLEVARKKGLVTDKETMESEGTFFLSCRTDKIPKLIRSAIDQEIYYYVLLGVDDDIDTSIMVVSKQDARKFNVTPDLSFYKNEYGEPLKISECIGEYFLELIPKRQRGNFTIYELPKEGKYSIHKFRESKIKNADIKEIIGNAYQRVLALNKSLPTSQIPFHIKLPLGRSIISVLEQLKKEGIQFYIPPVDIAEFDMKKSEPFYRIYIDRQYLQLYKEKVHANISNPQKGAVVIGDENIDFSEMILRGSELPCWISRERE